MGNNNSNGQPAALTETNVQFILNNSGFTREQVYEWHREFLVSNFFLFTSNY